MRCTSEASTPNTGDMLCMRYERSEYLCQTRARASASAHTMRHPLVSVSEPAEGSLRGGLVFGAGGHKHGKGWERQIKSISDLADHSTVGVAQRRTATSEPAVVTTTYPDTSSCYNSSLVATPLALYYYNTLNISFRR